MTIIPFRTILFRKPVILFLPGLASTVVGVICNWPAIGKFGRKPAILCYAGWVGLIWAILFAGLSDTIKRIELEALVTAQPTNAAAKRKLASFYLQADRNAEANELYIEADRNDPEDSTSALETARAYFRMHDNTRAHLLLNRYFANNSRPSRDALNLMASIQHNLGNKEVAQEYLREAEDLSP